MKRLLITGASGFLGWNLSRAAGKEWDVFGAVFRNSSPIEGVTLLQADLTLLSELRELMRAASPDAVIHTAAISQPNICQNHRNESYRVNVEATKTLAGMCGDLSIPFVFTSTDMVFDGRKGCYREEDAVNPVNAYGEQKAQAEEAVFAAHPGSAVCRMSLMYGHAGPGAASFIQDWIAKMKEGRELRLFTDEYRTFLSARDAAAGLLLALSKVRGLLHLGGPERASRLRFGLELRRAFGLSGAVITPSSLKESNMPAPRPPDISLDSTRAVSLGFRPGAIGSELAHLARASTL
ncbi:MAG: SDR family oxidoreductase [Desulfobacteraceae bacterium]|nr:SDR family oxidoreductase [Desulfobacteraceae bacterium]